MQGGGIFDFTMMDYSIELFLLSVLKTSTFLEKIIIVIM